MSVGVEDVACFRVGEDVRGCWFTCWHTRLWACCAMLGALRCGVGEAWAELRRNRVYVACWADIDEV